MMKMGIIPICFLCSRVIEFCQKASVEELRAKGAVHMVLENG